MLIGREVERAQLDRLLEGVLAGHGSAVLVRGEAGIGKSALLAELRGRALTRGVTVLSAQGIESEADLGFSTLGDLLAPLHGDLGNLPDAQAAALAGALALAPPAPGDRFALCVATLGLLLRAASRTPLLVLVDDVQWIDASSRECVLFAARRTAGSMAVVLAGRDGAAVGDVVDLPLLHVRPLGRPAALDLLAEVAPGLDPAMIDLVLTTAAGSPLALLELPGALQHGPGLELAQLSVPLAPGPLLSEVYGRRIDALRDPERRALQVAAVFGGDEVRVLVPACAAVGCGADDLASAEAAGLLRVAGERVTFTHPLVRAAAYHRASPRERRDAHAALAGVLIGRQRAWHLGAAALGPDETVAAELETTATETLARRAPGPASLAFERAARLSPDRAQFTRRVLAAGKSAAAAGRPERALALLDEAAADSGPLRAPARHLQALTLLWCRGVGPAIQILLSEAEQVEARDPALAASMLADASLAYNVAADTRRALLVAERAVALLGNETDPAIRAQVLVAMGWALLLRGEAPRARPVLAEADGLVGAVDPLGPTGDQVKGLLYAHLVAGELERAYDESQALCVRAREAGALAVLPNLLVVVADSAYRLGRWNDADMALAEAMRIGHETGQAAHAGHAGVIAARLAAARGDEHQCRETLEAVVAASTATGACSGLHYAHAALGFLELGLTRVTTAVERLTWVARRADEDGMEEPTLIPWAADLVEAYLRTGRERDAREALAVLGRRAAGAGSTTAAAGYARCQGMIEADFDGHFDAALRLDDERPMPFERARTLLAYGRRLHRAKRRAEARDRLHEALVGFERLGAAPWAAQVHAELRAAGGRRRSTPRADLTPQEWRVAHGVVSGGSNRAVAAELFLSPKTVEFHLSRVYRKLGVASRTQLVKVLATSARPQPQPEEE